MGTTLTREQWEALDLRQYDPRRVVRDAFHEPARRPAVDPDAWALVLAQADQVRPGQTYLVLGSAAHPRRIRLDSLAVDDPRRLATEVEVVPEAGDVLQDELGTVPRAAV